MVDTAKELATMRWLRGYLAVQNQCVDVMGVEENRSARTTC